MSKRMVGPEGLQLNREGDNNYHNQDGSRLSWWAQKALDLRGTLGRVVSLEELELIRTDIASILAQADLTDPFNAYDITGQGYDEPTP